jgi:hypothetical protein
MRKIVVVVAVPVAIGAVLIGAARTWRRSPRVGTAFVNSVVNPLLLRRGLAGRGRSEIATLEHIGRRSGIKRLTPVHPEATESGFRIVVPLGTQSEWARNVIAAGHCRLQLHDQVFDLDEPLMVGAAEAADLPWALRRLMAALGFKYLNLRTFAAHQATRVLMDGESLDAGTFGRSEGVVVAGEPAGRVTSRWTWATVGSRSSSGMELRPTASAAERAGTRSTTAPGWNAKLGGSIDDKVVLDPRSAITPTLAR